MAVPAAYAKIRQQQDQEAAELRARSEAATKQAREEEAAKFRELEKALQDYNGASLDDIHGNVDRIGIYKTSTPALEVSRNGEKWLQFDITWEHSSCNCEGPCNCRCERWCVIRCRRFQGNELRDYFFDVVDWKNEEQVARGFMRALEKEREFKQYSPIQDRRANESR